MSNQILNDDMPDAGAHRRRCISITGVFDRVRWRADDESNFIIGYLVDGTCIKGKAEDGELTPGLTYTLFGKRVEDAHGTAFRFTLISLKEPHGRNGIVAYLTRYATGVGPAVAAKLWDAFAGDAVKVLRTQPDTAAATVGHWLPLEKAQQASIDLRAIAQLEDTKIELTNLFAGRGFPNLLIDECIRKWRILAPARVKRDPFCLLVEEMTGCGFARCDRLYADLGLPPERLKRQTICLWHVLHADSSGNTWIDADVALARLGEMISGARLQRKKAILLGCKAGWLARRRDENGKLWLAEGKRAANEAFLAKRLIELSRWEPPVAGAPDPEADEADTEMEAELEGVAA